MFKVSQVENVFIIGESTIVLLSDYILNVSANTC